MVKLKLLLVAFMVIFTSFASAQDITSGILTDELQSESDISVQLQTPTKLSLNKVTVLLNKNET
jgi:hypothetical protein